MDTNDLKGIIDRNDNVTKQRIFVLDNSLMIEKSLSELICLGLDISDHKESISFGYSGQSLSFNQKVNLIIDMNGCSKEYKSKFQIFMQIRNALIHNLDFDTFEDYFSNSKSGKDDLKKLMKFYAKDVKVEGEDLYIALIYLLCSDIAACLVSIYKEFKTRRNNKLNLFARSNLLEISTETIKELREQLNQLPLDIDEIKTVFKKADCKGFGDFFYLAFANSFDTKTKKSMEQLNKVEKNLHNLKH